MEKFRGLYEKGLYEIAEDLSESKLNNKNITPIRLIDRNWGMFHYITLWVSIIICFMSYINTSKMMAQGMVWWQVVLTVFFATIIVLIPIVLNSHAGAKYGLSSPVLLRVSFGVYGAKLPVLLRAIVACLWFGLQTRITASIVYSIINGAYPELSDFFPIDVMGLKYLEFCCYFLVLFLSLLVIYGKMKLVRNVCVISAPILVILMILFLVLMHKTSGNWSSIITKRSTLSSPADFLGIFFLSFSILIVYWLPLSVNISDFTRYAKSQRDHILGQSLSLPIAITLFAFLVVVITLSTFTIFGRYVWDPAEIFARLNNPIFIVLAVIGILISGVIMNVVVNLVAGGMAFSSLAPKKISFRGGAVITAIVGTLIIPKEFSLNFINYIYFWLITYSAILSPILGIMLCDYFLIRRSAINPADLYDTKGVYRYNKGVNYRAIIALIIGILPSLPAILFQMNFFSKFPLKEFLNSLYPLSIFIGFFLSLIIYYILMHPESKERDTL